MKSGASCITLFFSEKMMFFLFFLFYCHCNLFSCFLTDSYFFIQLPAFFFFNLDQDDIGTDLADTFPGNDVFGIAAEKTADLCRTGNNDCFHKSGTDIDIHIAYTAKRTAGTGVDHFFLPQFTDSHKIPTPSFEIERTDRCTQDSRCFRKVFFL